MNDEQELSLPLVLAALLVVCGYLSWCVLANSYTISHPDSNLEDLKDHRLGFFLIGLGQLPNLFPAIGWHFTNRQWVMGISVLILLFPVGLAVILTKLAKADAELQRRKDGIPKRKPAQQRKPAQRKGAAPKRKSAPQKKKSPPRDGGYPPRTQGRR